MPRSVGVAVGICSILVAAWNCAACSSSEHPSAASSGGSAAAAAAAATSNGGNGGLDLNGVNGGTANGNGTANGPGLGDGETCAADVSTAQAVPLDIYIMLDVSSSMLDLTAATTSKWDAVKVALEAFLKDNASAGLGVGLQYFPLLKPNAPTSCTKNADCGDSGPCFLKSCASFQTIVPCDVAADCINTNTNQDFGPCAPLGQCAKNTDYVCRPQGSACGPDDTGIDLGNCVALTESTCMNPESCEVTSYSTPDTTIAALPGAAAGLVASIDARMPSGSTPTGPALTGAIQQASAWAKAHPDHRVITLLATDGLPTQCTPTAIGSVAAIAQAGVVSTPSISTFVIGVFGPADVANGAPDNLNEIAQQGGTKAAFIVDTQKDVTAQFLSALDAIRGARLACEFLIPQPASSEMLDYGRVNVQFTAGTQKDYVYYVKTASACDTTTGGWYYDVDPAVSTPTKIIACPTSCTAFQNATSGSSVGIALGCSTVVK